MGFRRNGIVWSIVALFMHLAMTFLTVPVITAKVGIEAYGFYSLSLTLISYIDIIAVSYNSFAGRFISVSYHRGDIKRAGEYYASQVLASIILFIFTAIPSVIWIFFAEKTINIPVSLVVDVKVLFLIVLLNYFFVLFRSAFEVSPFIKNRIDIIEKARAASIVIQALLLCAFFYLMQGHIYHAAIALLASSVFFFFVLWLARNKLTPTLRFSRKNASLSDFKEFVQQGMWTSFNNLGNILNDGLDLLITNLMITNTIMGMVSISKATGTVLISVVRAVSNSQRPEQLRYYSIGEIDKSIGVFKNTMRLTGVIYCLMAGGFIGWGMDFLRLWIPNQDYRYVFLISLIVMIGNMLIGVVQPLYYVFTLTKRMKIPCIITILMGVANVLAMYVLLKYTSLGGIAVVLTTAVLHYVHLFDTPLYAAKCFGVSWKTFYPEIIRHLMNCLTGAGAAFIIARFLPETTSWAGLIVKVLALMLPCVISSVIIIPSSEERKRWTKEYL